MIRAGQGLFWAIPRSVLWDNARRRCVGVGYYPTTCKQYNLNIILIISLTFSYLSAEFDYVTVPPGADPSVSAEDGGNGFDEIAASLFDNASYALGKKIRLYGRKFVVIGVLEKEGSSLFGGSKDTSIFIPSNVVRRIYGDNNKSLIPFIVIKPFLLIALLANVVLLVLCGCTLA